MVLSMDLVNDNLLKTEEFMFLTLQYFKKLMEEDENVDFYIFGSQPFNYLLNGKFLDNSDIDVLCNKVFFDNFMKSIGEYYTNVKKDVSIETNGLSMDGPPSLLKFNLIDNLIKVKITIDDIEFKFDFVITSWDDIYEVISKYSQNLISSKCIVYDYELNDNNIIFRPLFSHNIVKSLYRPDVCNGTMRTLMYYTNLYSKLFNENGLNIDYELVKRDDVKNIVNLNDCKNEDDVFIKLLETVFDKRISWLTFESDIYLRFIFFNELFTFPLTQDMKYYLENLNLLNKIKGEYDLYKRWLFLLERTLSKEVISKYLKKKEIDRKEFMDSKDIDFLGNKINILIKDLRECYEEFNDECTCYICMDEFEMNSPIHTCINGHFTHLTCAMKQKRIFINKALRDINFDAEFEEDTNNCCGMCREQQIDIDALPVIDHSNLVDLYKYKDVRMKNLDLHEYSDYLLDKNSSINICECGLVETSSDYILRKVEYLKKNK